MRLCFSLLVFGCLLAIGCGKPSTSAPVASTSPDATKGGEKTAEAGKIQIEPSPITVQKGKSTTITIKAMREDIKTKAGQVTEVRYKGPINLEFDISDTPGLKIEPAVIPAGKESVEVTVTAAADASGGMVKITGKAPGLEPHETYVRADVR
jgi:hypothetical protein